MKTSHLQTEFVSYYLVYSSCVLLTWKTKHVYKHMYEPRSHRHTNQSEGDRWWLRNLCGSSGSQTTSIDPFFFSAAVNLNSHDRDCSCVQTAGKSNDLRKKRKKEIKNPDYMLECNCFVIYRWPHWPTLVVIVTMHRYTKERQFSVHNMKRVKGSLH